jgi:hypothetical protein
MRRIGRDQRPRVIVTTTASVTAPCAAVVKKSQLK